MASVLDPTYLKFCEENLIDMYNWQRDKISDFLSNACTTEPNETTKQTLFSVYKQFSFFVDSSHPPKT